MAQLTSCNSSKDNSISIKLWEWDNLQSSIKNFLPLNIFKLFDSDRGNLLQFIITSCSELNTKIKGIKEYEIRKGYIGFLTKISNLLNS